MNDDELERYSRQIVLKEIGGHGQSVLRRAKVAIIGAGGIGSPAIQYLAAAGIGRLTVIDDDMVSLSNLQRQTLYRTDQIGGSKVAAAKAFVAGLNPLVDLRAECVRIDTTNAAHLLDGADIVLDGSDNFETRFTVADCARAADIPLVSAAIGSFEGQIAVIDGVGKQGPCLRCAFPGGTQPRERSCADQGVMGALAGMIGSFAALEVVRCLVPFGEPKYGKLVLLDMLNGRYQTLGLKKRTNCACRAGT